MFKIPLFGLSSVFYTSCTKKEPYLFIGKTHKFKNCLNLMTLGIYCRPSCKSKLPKRGNVVFFKTKEDAENAGFRPCKRCRPDLLQ